MAQAYTAGAVGYLVRDFSRQRLLDAIHTAAAGGRVWNREEMRRISGVLMMPQLEIAVDIPLTPREVDVLRKVVLGRKNFEIAQELGISYETVKEHVQHLLNKIAVEDRTQAALWAVRQGLA
jgi:DNA-binding NarL/FixJ family response regulator